MNRTDAMNLVIYARQLWDGWKPSDALVELVADILAHDWLDAGEGRAILVHHRRTHEYLTPNPAALTKLVAAKRRELLLAKAEADKAATELEPMADRRTLGEWRRWYAETDEGRREWSRLRAETRRGLRVVFQLDGRAS